MIPQYHSIITTQNENILLCLREESKAKTELNRMNAVCTCKETGREQYIHTFDQILNTYIQKNFCTVKMYQTNAYNPLDFKAARRTNQPTLSIPPKTSPLYFQNV